PRPRATSRTVRARRRARRGRPWSRSLPVRLAADGLKALAVGEALGGEGEQPVDPPLELAEGVRESRGLGGIAAFHRGRVGNAPVRADRAAGPDRAAFRRGAVADGEDQVELGPFGELAPAFRAVALGRIAERLERVDRPRVDRAGRVAPGAEGAE